MQTVLAVSGGMDSTALLLKALSLGHFVTVLNFNYGQKHLIERGKLRLNLGYLEEKGFDIRYHEVNLGSIMSLFNSSLTTKNLETPKDQHYSEANQRVTVVPNRNAIFASLIYGLALSKAIEFKTKAFVALGIHSGDYSVYPDCRPEFIEALENAFKIGNWDSELVEFFTPYMKLKKEDILKDARVSCNMLNLDFEIIFQNTNTCYSPDEKGRACGHCASCIERLEAFNSLGIKDPAAYVEDYDMLAENAKKINKRG